MTTTLLNNRYQVIQVLSAGGFGETFLAEDTYMPSRRRCVIKQLKPVTNDPKTYRKIQQRFEREAATLEYLGEASDQIPKLYAYFSENGQFYKSHVPAFPTGTPRGTVEAVLGKPAKDSRGVWGNTRAVTYKLVPNQIELGYLFNRDSGVIRQTEVAFAQSVDFQIMLTTSEEMLGGKATEEVKQGLQQVQQRQLDNYRFTKGSLKGQIVRQQCDLIYISIWDADLHDFESPSDSKKC